MRFPELVRESTLADYVRCSVRAQEHRCVFQLTRPQYYRLLALLAEQGASHEEWTDAQARFRFAGGPMQLCFEEY